ncbi:helix-turn-helix domain-containing protein [Candidatus Halobonum tyrrellensis]|uniref:DNA binding domain-containing protein n=1 Tax=Candidatus Halobonum tyrrellensis G22 TaxID=1324957 RepID=V4GQY4_9EURY|nr:helix-turn-helix domain-containing protein [Candidatus Halobonum tyrrellensis]ESP87461.1 DNA binding domain-containing protein [Candidatus Halobonum tyrrellensis G22]
MSRTERPGADGGEAALAPARTNLARFSLAAEAVGLAGLFDRDPDASAELEPAVAAPDDLGLLVVRTERLTRDAVDEALRADPALDRAERFGGCDDAWEYGIRWADATRRLVGRVVGEGAVVSSATACGGRWYLRVTSRDRSTLLDVHELLGEFDPSADCLSVTTLDGSEQSARCVLTEKQRRTVMAAFEAGYYDVPRRATTEEIAEDLGVSHQALSERFRRAHAELVRAHLPVEDDAE